MIRTQIYLPEIEHKELNKIAKKKKQPMAEVIRMFIHIGLKNEKIIDRSGIEVMKRIVNMKLKGGPPDLSSQIDHYLYKTPKK